MPALYLRLKGGRLWNDAGFRGRDRVKWRNLCRQVSGGRFVPILGPGVAERLGRSDALARRLADVHRFPLSEHQKADLPRVLQFISAKEKRSAVVPELEEQWTELVKENHGPAFPTDLLARLGRMELPEVLNAVGEHCRRDPDEPHRILAGLPAEIYVTTGYDDLLGRALEDAGREPQRLVCRWRDEPPIAPSPEEEASVESPAVYHLLGSLEDEESLVLTEDDYFDYLIATAASQLIPDDVASVLGDRSLLFVGFQLTDWSFRVLFRLILSFEGRRLKDYPHVAVQVDPSTRDFADAEGARDYLRQYFGAAADIDVYWGSAEDFLVQLRDKFGGTGDG
ncbi:MAG: SIR2 family protein [bacterium]|nr:SIR2 family protein [bacterium]